MNKVRLVGCIVAAAIPTVLVVLLVGVAVIDACTARNPVKLAARLLGTHLPEGTVPVTKDDTGSGLPIPGGASDGYTWTVLKVAPDKIATFSKDLAASPQWKPLPLSPVLVAGVKDLQPTLTERVKGHFPSETAKGFYRFTDEQAEYNREYPKRSGYDISKPFYQRHSLDFVLGLFDVSTGMIYVWSINT